MGGLVHQHVRQDAKLGHTNKVIRVHHQVDVLHQLHSLLAAILQRLRCELPLDVPALPEQCEGTLSPIVCILLPCGSAWRERRSFLLPQAQTDRHHPWQH